jgi:plastocyanin
MTRHIARGLVALLFAAALTSVVACGGGGGSNSTAPPNPMAKELNSPLLGNGAIYMDTLAAVGAYPYHCSIHTGMMGTVVVDGGSAVSSAAVSISGFAFAPASVTVKPGGVVTWTNNDATHHTVTSN